MSSLLLLSGGIDSTCLAAQLRPAVCLTVDYGQRAAQAETQAAAQVCRSLGLKHVIHNVNVGCLGSGQMAGQNASPLSENAEFWPFRNQLLITLAGMLALQEGCTEIVIGSVVTDNRHADGSSTFRKLLHKLMQVQEGGLSLKAPAAHLTSEQLISTSGVPWEVLSWAHSCHTNVLACGQCPGCVKHSQVMQSVGLNR